MPRFVERVHDRARQVLSLPGPGIITGAADDDPGGIATYSITGAQTGYSLLWTSVLTFPLNAAIQNMCARIGLVTGQGLAHALKHHNRRTTLSVLVALLLIANTANIGADIAAVASGVELLTGVPYAVGVIPIGVGIALSEIVVPYRLFSIYLKILTLVLFTYIIDAFVAGPDWSKALEGTILPHLELDAAFIATIVAIFGTTISPYLFFWQASEEVEELHESHKLAGTEPDLRRAQFDVDAGMLIATVVFYFIVLTTAATLHASGDVKITTAREAAEALRPLAGDYATALFAIGFIGTGLLAIPVLAGSGAYAVAEIFDWREGLDEKPRAAPQFYSVIAASTLIGLGIAVANIGAIEALFASAVINGVVAPILIWSILAVSNDSEIVGRHRNGAFANVLGYATFGVMSLAVVAMAVTFLLGA